MKELNTAGPGKLLEANSFLVVVVEGTAREMGRQYGELMRDAMQKTWEHLIAPARESGAMSETDVRTWSDRAATTCSSRNRAWYEGVAEGSGWSLERVCMLDHVMEFGVYQAKLHSFAGCTSILSWGSHSSDGGMYVGRNMDWSEAFNKFPQVLTVRKPTDGSLKLGTVGWPGMYCPFTALNERGVYFDLHDGTSMGGSLVYKQRPSILSTLTDILSEVESAEALTARLNGIATSASMILSLADEKSGASMECSSLGGNRLRHNEGNSLVVVNTFLGSDWGLGKRETVSNSLRRFSNMTERLAEQGGRVDADVTRALMDLRLFNEDGSFAEKGGCTKPALQDADLTTHQVVTDVKRRKVWLKVPVPAYFADWTPFQLQELWS